MSKPISQQRSDAIDREGGYAFPVEMPELEFSDGSRLKVVQPGMTMLDYFAAHALRLVPLTYTPTEEGAARLAYNIAQAMLDERSRRLKGAR